MNNNKNNTTNLWWKKTPDKKNAAKDISFQTEIFNFFYNFTPHCYRWLVDPKISIWELIIWIIVHIIGIVSVIKILLSAWDVYSMHPMITALYDTLYPIEMVPFPGIAICNNNRLSKATAEAFAHALSLKFPNNNESYYFENIRHLGKLYDLDLENENELLLFQSYLDNFDLNDSLDSDSNNYMKRLSPQCSDLLIRCQWRGVDTPCLIDYTMMEFRKIQYGYCCTFNYVRPDILEQAEPPSHFVDDTGPDLGLILLLNGSSTDYLYPLYSFKGFIVQIFSAYEYPDWPSGGMIERVVEFGTETFLRIDAITLISEEETRRYSPETRDCLFADELEDEFGGRYKKSDCVLICRVASIVALCNCVPFYIPILSFKDNSETFAKLPKCTLEHIACLNHYKIKWTTMILKLKKIIGLEKEIEDGLYCPNCLSSCSDVIYKVSSTSLPLIPTQRITPNILSGISNISDVSLVRIFFGQAETWFYKQTVAIKWFEIISNLGGMCGVITGISLISIIEIFYFIIRRLILSFQKVYKKSNEQTLQIIP